MSGAKSRRVCEGNERSESGSPLTSSNQQSVTHVLVCSQVADQAGDDAAERMGGELQAFGACCSRHRPNAGKDWNELLQTQGAEAVRASLASIRATDPLSIYEPVPPGLFEEAEVDPFADD
ncbi:MAG: toprim domain-containing protein [Fimbriimonadaceae bacterium]|nr:toprim domain-containing protein [Fimbriimonadaceae bacterium]